MFIPAHTNIDQNHPDIHQYVKLSKEALTQRWNSSKGREIIAGILNQGWQRSQLEQQVGALYGQLDLRGVPLSKADLSGRDFSQIDFFAADLSRSRLYNTTLNHSHFSEADLRHTCFDWSTLDQAYFDNAIFDTETSFTGVALQRINFNLAALLHDQAHSQQRITHLNERNPYLAKLLRITTDYGRSIQRWLLWVVGVILTFALLFYLNPGMVQYSAGGEVTYFIDNLYFSVVTFTTLGYGDITAVTTLGRILVLIEVMFGYLMGGLLVAILAKKVLI